MPKAPAEHVAEFLLEFLPGLLPKPVDSAVKSAIGAFKDTLGEYLKQPRLKRQLLEAAQGAEGDFRAKAKDHFDNDKLTQAVASFPLFDRDLFQSALQSLPDHLHEDYLADHLKRYIADDWKGKFTPAELREAAALYLNCLRLRLLKVDGYADLVARLAVLRTDERTEQILVIVQELLELVRQLLAREAASQAFVASLFTILPPVTDFTGREDELAQLKASFQRGAHISGLTGAGGIGKTELARKLAQELADDYPAARLELNLRGADPAPLPPEDAMRRLLERFYPNQKLPDDPAELRGLYQQTFAQHKSLLLLDNAADAAQARPLLPPAPSAAILTSRRHFSLTEAGLTPLRLDALPEAQALQFLRKASPKLAQAPEADVETLAKLCGFLPLALRVAASILEESAVWTPARLIARLQDERTRLGRLKREGDPDLDVEASLSLSYNLLPDDLKQAFRRLSVFTDPFDLPAAQAVLGVDDDGESLERLDKLLNRSLVNLTASSPGRVGSGVSIHPSDYSTAAVSAGRVDASEASDVSRPAGEGYSLHDLTRLFAYEKLLEDEAEARAAILTHARHFLKRASAANDLYQKGGENILPALAQFRSLYPHLQAAFVRLAARQGGPEADRWLSDFPRRCAYVLDLHLPPREKIPLLEHALEASRRLKDKNAEGVHLCNLGLAYADLGDARQAIAFYEQALAIDREIGDRRGEGADLGNLGLAYADLGDARQAIAFYEQALAIAREIGDRQNEGNWLGNLGNAYADLGDARKAIAFYEQQLVIVREIGDRRGEGYALGNLGPAYAALGDARKAIAFYEQALVISREIGDRRAAGSILGNLGLAYADLGDARQAIAFYEQALVISREIGDRRNEGNWLGNLGNVYADLGDARKAIAFYEQALAIAREIGDRRGEGNALGNLGLAYFDLGDARKAIAFYEQRLEIAREIGDRRGEGNALGGLGNAYFALGDARKAIAFYEKQLVIVREIGDRRGEGNALGNLGNAYFALGDARQAIAFYEQQLVIVREIGDRQSEGNALGNLGSAYAALGDARQAIAFYEQRLEIAREIGDRRGEGNALANMGMAYKTLGEKAKAKKLWQEALAIYRAIESPHAKLVEKWLEGV